MKRARERCNDPRKLVAVSVDPDEHLKATKAARADRTENSFEVLWCGNGLANIPQTGVTATAKVLYAALNKIFSLGLVKPPLTVPELLKVLQRIESRTALEPAHLALGDCGEILRCSIKTQSLRHSTNQLTSF